MTIASQPDDAAIALPPAPSAGGHPGRDTYVLGRDFRSASRLNYEHYLWRETLGYNLHPFIAGPASSQPRLCIADVACGTGIWLSQTASEYGITEAAVCHGYDINLSQIPPREWLPENVTRFREWDLYDEPTEDMRGVYDVVHIRLVLVVVRADAVRNVVRNLMKLLKPGGWLQWDELDVERSYVLRLDDGSGSSGGSSAWGISTPVMDAMVEGLTSGSLGVWVKGLAQIFEECGMMGARNWEVKEKRDLARAFFDNHLAKDEEMASWRYGGMETKEGKQLLDQVKDMWRESQNGAVIVTPKVVVTARMPS